MWLSKCFCHLITKLSQLMTKSKLGPMNLRSKVIAPNVQRHCKNSAVNRNNRRERERERERSKRRRVKCCRSLIYSFVLRDYSIVVGCMAGWADRADWAGLTEKLLIKAPVSITKGLGCLFPIRKSFPVYGVKDH